MSVHLSSMARSAQINGQYTDQPGGQSADHGAMGRYLPLDEGWGNSILNPQSSPLGAS